MDNPLSLPRVSDWSIRWKLGLHLLFILLVVAANLAGVWVFVQAQEQDGAGINTAGEQRMLTQQMTWQAHQIGMGELEYRKDLARSKDRFDRQLTALIEGNETMGIPAAPSDVEPHFQAVAAEWNAFAPHLETVLTEPPESEAFQTSLRYIETNNEQLLAASDTAVQEYEAVADGRVATLQQLLFVLLVVDAALLASIFVVMDRRVLRDLETLTTDASTISNGALDREISTFDRDDEVGTLARSIQEMKSQLLASIHETEKFREAVHHAGHAIYITDPDGTIQYVNPAFEEITGYEATDAVGNTPRILHSGEQDADYYAALWETITAGETWEEEIVNERSTGEHFHAYQTIAPVTTEAGEIDAFVAIMADQTEQIVREQQTQVLGRLLRHNLRNELNVIELHAQQIREETRSGDISASATAILDRAGALERISGTTSRFDGWLAEKQYRRPMAVCETVGRVCNNLAEQHPHADVEFSCRAGDAIVRTRLDLITEELVENGILHADHPDPTITVQVDVNGSETQTVRLRIADDGPGIPAPERAVILEGEETSLFHGSGVGLWVVNWLITLAGGQIDIDEREPRGTVITIRLPLIDESNTTVDADVGTLWQQPDQ